MDSELVQVASFGDVFEADQWRMLLEENGVATFIDGANANAMMPYVGTALGGVRLLVASADQSRAAEIIGTLRQQKSDGAPWFCGRCREEVDAGFDTCWSCGRPRAEVESQPAAPLATPSEVASSEAAPDTDPAPATSTAEALIARAWRAAVLGIVFLPGILHLYSLSLLIRTVSIEGELSPALARRFRQTCLADAIMGGAAAYVFHSFWFR